MQESLYQQIHFLLILNMAKCIGGSLESHLQLYLKSEIGVDMMHVNYEIWR